MKNRIILFVDHEIGLRLLKKIVSLNDDKGLNLVAVVTTHENGNKWWPGVEDFCRSKTINLIRYSEPFQEILVHENIDWYFLLSWKHIIPHALYKTPNKGTINLHYSLLPDYRGVNPINWAIIEGQKTTGVTFHLVNHMIDGGKVICSKEEPIRLSDTARSLQLRLDEAAFQLFDEVVSYIACEKYSTEMLESKNETDGSYKSRLEFTQLMSLDLYREYLAVDLLNLFRGMTFLPGSKNLYIIDPESGKRIYIEVSLTPE